MIRAAGFLAVLALLAWALRRKPLVVSRYPDEGDDGVEGSGVFV